MVVKSFFISCLVNLLKIDSIELFTPKDEEDNMSAVNSKSYNLICNEKHI